MELFLDAHNAACILAAARTAPGATDPLSVRVSLDLNLTEVEVEVAGQSFRVGGVSLDVEPLAVLAESGSKLFRCARGDGQWAPLAAFSGRFAQLVGTRGAPTVEIDGIQMHRTVGTEPFLAARDAAASVVRPGDVVFDACGGLGYSSIHAVRQGAAKVFSSELCDAVRELRALNPWSRQEQSLAIELAAGDAFARLAQFEASSLNSVIHDPPRYSHAPELYSSTFYLRIHQALRPGGRMFHYTGAPYSRQGSRHFPSEVADRLRQAGFEVTAREELQGFVAVKRARRENRR